MPLYEFYCPQCKVTDEFFASPSESMTHICGTPMTRLFSAPRVVMKQSGRQMALDSLNNGDTNYMNPQHLAGAARGLEKPAKVFF